MELRCKNIGMIREAKVVLDGLTVIAGENDTGKSTLSKLVYMLVKVFDRGEIDRSILNEQLGKIKSLIDRINLAYPKIPVSLRRSISRELTNFFYVNYLNLNKEQGQHALLAKFQGFLDNANEHQEINIDLYTDEFKDILADEIDVKQVLKYQIYKFLESLFGEEINNKFSDLEGMVHLTAEKNVLNVVFNDNKVSNFDIEGELLFKDATFIETPFILHLSELIQNAPTILEAGRKNGLWDEPFVQVHIKELILKLRQPNKPEYVEKDLISAIINSDMDFDDNEAGFVLKKGNQRFKAINIAAGVKSFGMLQMLYKKGFIRERTILILDEPEVSVHPKWQIQYAKLLVDLVQETGVRVLLTSHSPYFIEAIKVYSDKKGLSKQTNFYLTEPVEDSPYETVIKDVTHNLDEVFAKLTQPFKDLELESMEDFL